MNTKGNISGWRSPWVLAAWGMLITVVGVNVAFIIMADRSNPGLVTEEYFKYGMQQNELGIQYREQLSRGWDVEMMLPKKIYQSKPAKVIIEALYKDGSPVTGAQAEVTSYRPSDAKLDVSFELIERTDEPGVYMTVMNLPKPGLWDLNILLEAEGVRHISSQRIQVETRENWMPIRSKLEKVVDFIMSRDG